MQVLTTTPFLPTGGVPAHGSVRGRRGAHPLENRGAVQGGARAAARQLGDALLARRLHASAHHGATLTTAHHCSSLSPAQVRAAARLLGDALLAKKLDELLAAIRRDLVVTPSLYTTGGVAGW